MDNFDLDVLGNEKYIYSYAFDMKVANIFLGLGTPASTYPCPWCEVSKNEFATFNRSSMEMKLRDLGSIRENASNYQSSVTDHKGKKN